MANGIEQFIDNELKSNDVVLFMKGTPQFPMCGFSGQVVQILDHLGVPHKISLKEWEPPVRMTLRDWERRQRRWVNDWVLPLFGRKLRGVTLGDNLSPRWPRPVKVPRKGGLKKLVDE